MVFPSVSISLKQWMLYRGRICPSAPVSPVETALSSVAAAAASAVFCSLSAPAGSAGAASCPLSASAASTGAASSAAVSAGPAPQAQRLTPRMAAAAVVETILRNILFVTLFFIPISSRYIFNKSILLSILLYAIRRIYSRYLC